MLLDILSYTASKINNQQIFKLVTNTNHSLPLNSKIEIEITGATNITFNGNFIFLVFDETTLLYKEPIFENLPINEKEEIVAGTIVANTVDRIILIAEDLIIGKKFKYTITQNGNYKILLDDTKMYAIQYFQHYNKITVGSRANDTDRIIYPPNDNYPLAIYSEKWLIIDYVKNSNSSKDGIIEIRLTLLN